MARQESPGLEMELRTEFVARSEQGPAVLAVSGRATYREALDLRTSLFRAISAVGDELLMVDLSEVRRIDTASMAVLLEGMISTRDTATEIILCGPAETVRKVFGLARLDEALGRWATCREEAMRMIGGRVSEEDNSSNLRA